MRGGTARTIYYGVLLVTTITLTGVLAAATAMYHSHVPSIGIHWLYDSAYYETALSPIFYASLSFCVAFIFYLATSFVSLCISPKGRLNSVLVDVCVLTFFFCFEFSCITAATVWVWHDGQFRKMMEHLKVPPNNLPYVCVALGWWLALLFLVGIIGMPLYSLRQHGFGTLSRTLYDLDKNGPWLHGPRASIFFTEQIDMTAGSEYVLVIQPQSVTPAASPADGFDYPPAYRPSSRLSLNMDRQKNDDKASFSPNS